MNAGVTLEVCVDSVESAEAAQEGGADRVELCAALLEGGTTPSAGMIRVVCQRLRIPVHVLVRPRGGDFCYSSAEAEVMKADIAEAGASGAAGAVIGGLNPDGTVDVGCTASLAQLARPMSVTFHRAFDMARDAGDTLEALVDMGIDHILTSGQEASALEGLELIAELVRRAAGRIGIMAAGGISERNASRIVAGSGVREVHASLRVNEESTMAHRNARVALGGALRPPEYSRAATSTARVRGLLQQLSEDR